MRTKQSVYKLLPRTAL